MNSHTWMKMVNQLENVLLLRKAPFVWNKFWPFWSSSWNKQIGGGGTYANIGARIWSGRKLSQWPYLKCVLMNRLPAKKLGMIIDRGTDFPPSIQSKLAAYGSEMWLLRDHSDRGTTRALNSYRGDHRRSLLSLCRGWHEVNLNSSFEYLTPRIRISPRDLENTVLARPATLHFICSPSRAASIMCEVRDVEGWSPITIYEPIPVCTIFQLWCYVLIAWFQRIDVFLRSCQLWSKSYPWFQFWGTMQYILEIPCLSLHFYQESVFAH